MGRDEKCRGIEETIAQFALEGTVESYEPYGRWVGVSWGCGHGWRMEASNIIFFSA